MNKKLIIAIITVLVIAVLIFAVFNNVNNNGEENTTLSTKEKLEETQTIQLTAEEIVKKLKENGLNIGEILVYTEESDPNKLLGRPKQYISKVNFADTRIEQILEDEGEVIGGTIETFSNSEDLQARKEYVEAFSSSPMFAQYIYSNQNVLLRIDSDLTPQQAQEYENALNKIMSENNL